jgi:hypothetical protein
MFPLHDYKLVQMRQEDLLREAEHLRLIRAGKLQSQGSVRYHRKWVSSLGTLLVVWGQKLEHFGTPVEVYSSQPTPSPHH